MTPMNLLICVVKEIVQLDGEGAQDNQTIVVYQSGSSAMERTTAETIVMNFQRTAQHAKLNLTLSARTTAAYLNNGHGKFL